jgi:hypothetical protein
MCVILVMLAFVTALPLPTQRGSAAGAAPFNIGKAVTGAKSPADHEAIASYYDRESATAKAKAEEHRKMALTYRHLSIPGRVQFPMENHCQQLAQYYEKIATEDAALAAAHRQMAREAAQPKP